MQGHSDIAASLLLRLLDTKKTAAVVTINNYIIGRGHIKAAATLACAFALVNKSMCSWYVCAAIRENIWLLAVRRRKALVLAENQKQNKQK